ncbi:MAG: RNA methyltransferase [Planctomycetota bacterium]|nr:RNA methyltransferase [Planctomycetota bacterium]
MKSPRIVLVEPQNPANIGFIARVLANFGVSDWVMAGGPEILGSEAERTGSAALNILTQLKRVDSIEEALEGCTEAIGFTARSGKYRQVTSLPALSFPQQGPVALVFGREDRGLETEEIERCSQLCEIPTAGLSSLNLSHAVAIVLYEMNRYAGDPVSEHQPRPATHEIRKRVLERASQLIQDIDFPDRGTDLDACLRRLEAVQVEGRDLRLVEKILKHSQWRRKAKLT